MKAVVFAGQCDIGFVAIRFGKPDAHVIPALSRMALHTSFGPGSTGVTLMSFREISLHTGRTLM